MNNKLISAASSYNIERSLIAPLVGKVTIAHRNIKLGAHQGFEIGDTTPAQYEHEVVTGDGVVDTLLQATR